MKKLITVLLISISLPLFAQNKTKVTIKQKGYEHEHGLRVIFGNKVIESNAAGEVLYEAEVDITEPTYAMVVQTNSRYTGFWIDPGHGEVIIHKEGFPGTTEVPGSQSHQVYKSIKFANTPKERYTNFLKHKNHPIALTYLNDSFQFAELTTEQLKELYEAVNDESKLKLDNLKAHLVTRDIPTVKVDSDIYDFIAQDREGESFDTKDYRGKYLLLDFAATGCGPCWSGYPELIAEASKYDNLQVLTFNQDDAIDDWLSLAEDRDLNINWPVLWTGKTKKEVFEIYNIQGWPNFFLISPEGKVLDNWMGSGGDKLPNKLAKFVK